MNFVKTKDGRSYLVPFLLITSLFFLWGFAHSILDVLNKYFQDAMEMSKTRSALIQAVVYGGYFLYSAMFAAIGSMVDNESDTQQFMLPVSLPLVIALIALTGTMSNPDNSLKFWLSIIPLTSPITMLARIPYGVPYSELFLSAVLLIVTFVAITWVASKIYRTGILMYGKKATLKEIWRWIRMK